VHLSALSCSVQILCTGGCGRFVRRPSNRSTVCSPCDYRRRHPAPSIAPTPASSTSLETIGSNAVSLLQSLPVHSHHRAPLLHHLAQGLTSTQASEYLISSASYIRECKRKNQDESDLLNEKYSSDVKRQKLPAEVILHLLNYIKDNCPTKSGSPRVELRQYVNDAELYQGYVASKREGIDIVCLNTFIQYKHELGVKRVKSYWGQFDCAKCLALRKMKPEWMKINNETELNQLRLQQKKGLLRDLLYHRVQYFHSSINTS
jgi:hypothetical protein